MLTVLLYFKHFMYSKVQLKPIKLCCKDAKLQSWTMMNIILIVCCWSTTMLWSQALQWSSSSTPAQSRLVVAWTPSWLSPPRPSSPAPPVSPGSAPPDSSSCPPPAAASSLSPWQSARETRCWELLWASLRFWHLQEQPSRTTFNIDKVLEKKYCWKLLIFLRWPRSWDLQAWHSLILVCQSSLETWDQMISVCSTQCSSLGASDQSHSRSRSHLHRSLSVHQPVLDSDQSCHSSNPSLLNMKTFNMSLRICSLIFPSNLFKILIFLCNSSMNAPDKSKMKVELKCKIKINPTVHQMTLPANISPTLIMEGFREAGED